jgi:hypothetical protein
MIKKLLIIVFILFAFTRSMFAQTFPVNASIITPFPHPVFLSDYYAPASNSMQVTLLLNDYSISSLNVKLMIELDNGVFNIKTKPSYIPSSYITLTPGVPLILKGSDLFDALNLDNMSLSGISRSFLAQNGGKLPEGQYTFCVKVLDAQLGKEISAEACNVVFLNTQQPPMITGPECGSYIQPSNPQNIIINWQLSGGGQPSMNGLNSYKLILYEITVASGNPANAVLNSQAVKIYESPSQTMNTLNLDFSKVLLQAGKQYVFRIQGMGPNGKQVFENDGYSEWCWFSYGYPTGGQIALDQPFEGKQFSKTDQKAFSWGASDKGVQGQGYVYKIKIVAQEDTTESYSETLKNGTVFHAETLSEVNNQDGGNFLLNTSLTPDKKYVWAIEAFSGGQLVAQSDIKAFYSHSLIEKFYASNREIKVVQITKPDLNDLAGKARIQLSEDTEDFVDVSFSGLKVKEVSGQMILEDGEINLDLSSRDEMEITPKLEVNGTGSFEYVSGRIDKAGLTVQGKIKWMLPHAVLANEQQEVLSKTSTFVMDSEGKLSGEAGIELFNTILMAPKDFKLQLKETSMLMLVKNVFEIKVVGDITLPESINTMSGKAIKVSFSDYLNQLNYIEIDNLIGKVSEGIAPYDNLKLEFIPLSGGVIDLSDDKSPAKLAADKGWKGFYVTGYKIRMHQNNFDQSNQLRIESRIDHNKTTDGTGDKFWIGSAGLTLKSELDLTKEEGVMFNTFKAKTKGKFEFKKNVLKKAIFEGTIKIPFVGDDEDFSFEITATLQGLEEGFLNEDLTKRDLVFNPFGIENKMNVKINRAVFQNNEWISMNLEVDIPEVGSKIESIEDFRVYGDNFIGVGGKNKSYTLDNFVPGKFKNLEFSITEFGAAYLGNSYALSYSAETSLSEGFSGEDGPPILAISSVMETTAAPGKDVAIPAPDIEVPDGLEGETAIKPAGIDLKIETVVVDGDAKLLFTHNDPKWGTKFEGGLNVRVKIPMALNLGTNLTLGITQDKMDYWYFDAYFEDKSSTGIPVYEPISLVTTGNQIKLFNITGMEGKIFRHMKATQENGKMTLDLADDVMFGIGLYAQIIDGDAKGFIFQADLGIEAEIKGQGFTPQSMRMSMSGEASFLNFNVRTGVNLKEVVAEVGKEVVKEVVNLAADAIFPIDFDIDNTHFKLNSTGFDNGELEIGNYASGNGFTVGANVSNKPSGKIGLAKDGLKFGGSADASGSGSFDFKISGIDLSAKMNQMNDGQFDLTVDGLSLKFGGDIQQKKGNFGFDYNGTKVLLDVDAPQKSGLIDVSISDVKFNSSINVPQKSARIGFDIQNNKFDMSFDGLDKKAALMADISGVELSTSFDINQKKGQLSFETSSESLELFGSSESALFKLESGSKLLNIETNFAQKTGKVNFVFPNNQLKGELAQDQASIFLKKNDFEIGLLGKFDGTKGDLHLKQGDFLFNLGADINSSNGYFSLAKGSVSLSSKYKVNDSTYIMYKDGSNLGEASYISSVYKTHLKAGSKEMLVEANPSKKSGRMVFAIPEFSFDSKFNGTAKTASFDFKKGGIELKNFYRNDSAVIDYSIANQQYKVIGLKDGSGSVYYADSDAGVAAGFGYNKQQQASSLLFQKGSLLIDIMANKSQSSGSILVQTNGDRFQAAMADSLFITTTISGTTFSAIHSTQKTGVFFASSDNQIGINKYANGGSVFVKTANTEIGLSKLASDYKFNYIDPQISILSEISTTLAQVDFKKGALEVSSSVGANSAFNFSYADGNLSTGMGGNLNDGTYSFNIDVDGWSGSIAENIKQKTTSLNLSKSNASLALNYLASNKSISLGYDDITIQGGLDQGKAFLSSSYKDVKFNAHQTNGVSLAMGNAVASFSNITNQQFDLGLAFDNHSVEVKQILIDGNPSLNMTMDGSPISMSPSDFSFDVNIGQWSGKVDASFKKKTAEIDVQKGDYELEIVYNDDDQYLGLAKANEKISGGEKNGSGFFEASYDAYTIEIDGNKILLETDVADFVLDNFNDQLFDVEAKIAGKTVQFSPSQQSGKYSLLTKLDNSSLNLSSDNFEIAIDESGYTGSFKSNLENSDKELTLTKGDYSIYSKASTSHKELNLAYQQFNIGSKQENNATKLTAGYNGLQLEVENNTLGVDFSGTDIEVKNMTANSYDIEFLLGNKNFIIRPSSTSATYQIEVLMNGSPMDLSTPIDTIFGGKGLLLEQVSSNKYHVRLRQNDLVFDLVYQENKAPKLALKKAGQSYELVLSNTQVTVAVNNHTALYNRANGTLSVEQGSNLFKLNESAIVAVVGDIETKISNDSITFEKGDLLVNGMADQIAMKATFGSKEIDLIVKKTGEVSAALSKDNIAVAMEFANNVAPQIGLSTDGNISEYIFTEDQIKVEIAGYAVAFDRKDNILELSEGTNEFKVSENLMAMKIDELEFEATPQSFMLDQGNLSSYIDENELRVGQRIGSNKVTAILQEQGGNKLEVEIGNHQLNIDYKDSEIPQVAYQNGDDQYAYQISDQFIGIIVADYTARYTKASNKVEVVEGSNKFALSPGEVAIDFDGYTLQATATAFIAEKGNYKTEIKQDKVAIQIDDKRLEFNKDRSFTLALASDQSISATNNSLAMTYKSQSLLVSDTEISFAKTDEQIAGQVNSNGASFTKGDYSLQASSNQLKFEKGSDFFTIENNSISGKYQQSEFAITANKTISYKDADRELAVSEQSLSLNYQDYGLAVLPNKVKMTLGTAGELIASADILSYNNDGFSFALNQPFNSPEIVYQNGDQKLKLSKQEMSVALGSKKFEVADNKFKVQLDDNHTVAYENNNLSLKYDKYEAGFTNYSKLTLNDGIKSFTVSNTELEANLDNDNGIKASLAQGSQGLTLTKDGKSFAIGANGASFTVAGFDFELNAQNYIKMQKENHKGDDGLYVNNAGLQYKQGDAELKLGTGEKVIELLYKNNNSLAFTKKSELVFTYDNSLVTTIHNDLSVTCVKGGHQVGINKADYMVGYTNTSIGADLQFKKFDKGVGLQASIGDYTSYVKGNKNADITVGIAAQSLGGFEFTANAQKDITLKGLKNNVDVVAGTMKGAKELKKLSVKLPNGTKIFEYNSEVDVMGETVDGIEEVSMDGPSHLSKISSEAMGWATAGVKMSLIGSSNPRLVMNGRIQTGLNVPILCADASFGSYIGKDGFLFKLADKNNRAQLKLICAFVDLPPVEGFAKFEVKPGPQTSFNVALGMRYRAEFSSGFSVGLGPACKINLTASMGAGFDFLGDATMVLPISGGEASFALNESYVDLFAYAKVTGSTSKACGGLSISASAAVAGRLAMKTTDNVTNVNGKASGKIEVGPISKSFDVNVDFDI